MTEAPFTELKVIDQTQALAGPYCTMMLGDLGADVIKIERPGVGDNSRQWVPPYIGNQSCYYLAVNRNKRGIALDIAADGGREILHKLIADADIFLTNLMTREALSRYAIDYDTLKAINPRLIYVSISGYGRNGPRADQPGYDLVAQAESGTIALTGDVEGLPMRFPTPMADITCGLYTLIGILTALHVRHRTGRGQFLDMSLQEGQITWLFNLAGEYFATGDDPPRRGNRHPQVVPYWVSLRTMYGGRSAPMLDATTWLRSQSLESTQNALNITIGCCRLCVTLSASVQRTNGCGNCATWASLVAASTRWRRRSVTRTSWSAA